jgi:hypothetical protein
VGLIHGGERSRTATSAHDRPAARPLPPAWGAANSSIPSSGTLSGIQAQAAFPYRQRGRQRSRRSGGGGGGPEGRVWHSSKRSTISKAAYERLHAQPPP